MFKILLLSTGGTISSILGSDGLAPRGGEIGQFFKSNYPEMDITIQEIMHLDSTNIQPEEWIEIAETIYKNYESYDGIVVTHGTDTLAYTTSMMSYMLQNPPIPIVFTGSQLPISHPLTDALGNIHCALAMCLTKTRGVFLAFDRKINLGCRVVKVKTASFNAFESINVKKVGNIDAKGLTLNLETIPSFTKAPSINTKINTNVHMIKLFPGMNPNIIKSLIKDGCMGLVIEAFGAGGIPFMRRDVVSAIEEAISGGIPVVVCSQCLYEKSDFSIYQAGQRVLGKGAIEAFDMTTEAVITKLMWLLGQSSSLEYIRSKFRENIVGEISIESATKNIY